ncbi:helix-turn-helix transcriptional regulator [Streptomyces sp. NPDC002490]|uniref:helix-turn-helix transcriptional regulator n=1 Tax=Streptomyces sp. NPDC002490 TaxID=3154416 RepID=UPI0033347766
MFRQPSTALPPELLDDEETRQALSNHVFGTVFRLARERAGISYSKIAAECDIKPERVGTLARGRGKVASFEKIVQIADALRVPGHMVGLASRPWEATRVPAGPSDIGGGDMLRRTIVQAATATGLASALPAALQHENPPDRVTESYVRRLEARAARLRRLDDVLGGGDTYRVYLGEVQRTKSILRRGSFTDTVRCRLTALLAEQTQQAGWAAFDGGHLKEATGLYEESRAYAKDAGHSDLHGNSLAFLAYTTLDRRTAVAFARGSCTTITARTPATVRALLHERLAWALAVDGQAAATEAALETARTALDGAQAGESQPDWSSWVDHTEIGIMSGRCWTELRRPLRAVPALTNALSRYPDTHAGDKALYLSWLAEAYFEAGEVEQAAVTTTRAFDLSVGVASVRPMHRIRPLLDKLSRHTSLSEVRTLLDRTSN